jgi:hypothetical protein
LRKSDLENQKIPAIGFTKTYFSHKATAGSTGINLASLTLPPELSANGITNPPTSQLTGAQLLFYKNNLTLVSSARGILQQGLSYSIASSSQINFIGFTALAGEIFTGTIDYTAQTGVKVVDASPINATGTLAATTTDFNVGIPFKVGQYSTTQIGGVMVFLDGVIQFRNTGNSSVTLDGNYREVDAGSGLGTIIRFNLADPDNVRNVLVVSNGLLSERPDGSMMAVIETLQGQVNTMAAYVAALAGQTPTTVLGSSPSNVDLKAFGDRVLAVEQNRARIDLSNSWTAVQALIGRTDGTTPSTGQIGEVRKFTLGATSAAGSTTNTTVGTFSLPAGHWLVLGITTMNTPAGFSSSATSSWAAAINSVNNIFGAGDVPLSQIINLMTPNASDAKGINMGCQIYDQTTTTTYYVNVFAQYGGTAPTFISYVTAIRVG